MQTYSKELEDFSFTLVTSVKEGYSFLSKFDFQLIYVILSGTLAEEFLDTYEENLRNLSVLTLNIIFCFNGKYHNSKKYANDPCYNPGGIVKEFVEVIRFLKKNKTEHFKDTEIMQESKINYENEKLFINTSKNIENISFPVILKKFASRFINDEDLEIFKEFIIKNCYKEPNEIRLLDILKSKIKIPYYLYSKIFLRLYTLESPFYRKLKISLIKGNYSEFKQYILILYNGLNQKIIKDYHDGYLYSSQFITKKELDSISSSSGRIILTKSFLSFSKDKIIATDFMRSTGRNVLLIVNPLKQKDATVTNMDIEEISYFKDEKEVLFLPFSGFEIEKIEKNQKYTIIYLNYLNKYEKKVMDYIDARSKDKVELFLKDLVRESQSNIFKDFISDKSIQFIGDYRNKKNVLWIDQYSRCKVYDNYLKQYSSNLKDFYFEKATTITEAFSILSNYEFKMIYIIINDKLSEQFFSEYLPKIKKLGVVTSNIIFCDEVPKNNKKYFNDPFLNPGKIVTNFAKVVEYLNADECGFKNILKMEKTIDTSFSGVNYGNIFKAINERQIHEPYEIINKIIYNLPSRDSIEKFKNFVYSYGNKLLSITVNPSQEKKIDLPLYIYPKYYMRMYGLETDFYYDINKYLTNQGNDFGIFNLFIKILYYGLSQNLLISNDEFPFYRGGVISKKEFSILEENQKLKKNIYSSKNFLSFSKSEEEANKFLERNLNCDDSLYPTKFIIDKFEKRINKSNLMSNVEMRHYSGMASEEEVLFLPLSSFMITYIGDSIYMNKKIKVIKFIYLGMFDNKINKPDTTNSIGMDENLEFHRPSRYQVNNKINKGKCYCC